MESSFAFCENTILFKAVAATCPWGTCAPGVAAGPCSAGHDDFEGGGSRFVWLVDLESVGGAADGEFVTAGTCGGVAVTVLHVRAGESPEVLNTDGRHGEPLGVPVDGDRGVGEIAADGDRPIPVLLRTPRDVIPGIGAVDRHLRRAGELSLGPCGAGTDSGDSKRSDGRDDHSVRHKATSILDDGTSWACNDDAILRARE